MEIILASSSPRRREILSSLGLRYKVIPPDVDENIFSYEKNPRRLVETLALQKALSVLAKIRVRKNTLIFGADTIVVFRRKIIGKPSSFKDAVRMLAMLSGSRHKVYTGIAIVAPAVDKEKITRIYVSSDVSVVKMRHLAGHEIETAARLHKDKAGAYAVQEKNDGFVKHIDGDYYNVVGLPVKLFISMLKKASRRK